MARGSVWESDPNSPDWQCDTPGCGNPHVNNRRKCNPCVSERKKDLRKAREAAALAGESTTEPTPVPEPEPIRRTTCYAHKTLNKWKISESVDQRYFKK